MRDARDLVEGFVRLIVQKYIGAFFAFVNKVGVQLAYR